MYVLIELHNKPHNTNNLKKLSPEMNVELKDHTGISRYLSFTSGCSITISCCGKTSVEMEAVFFGTVVLTQL